MINATCFYCQFTTVRPNDNIKPSSCENCGSFFALEEWKDETGNPAMDQKVSLTCDLCKEEFFGERWKKFCIKCYKKTRTI